LRAFAAVQRSAAQLLLLWRWVQLAQAGPALLQIQFCFKLDQHDDA
jgi:hypothetical protein